MDGDTTLTTLINFPSRCSMPSTTLPPPDEPVISLLATFGSSSHSLMPTDLGQVPTAAFARSSSALYDLVHLPSQYGYLHVKVVQICAIW